MVFFGVQVSAQDLIKIPVTDFRPEKIDSETIESLKWDIIKLPKRNLTSYSLHKDSTGISIKAESTNSASGLVYQVDINPEEYPIIEWSWKIERVLDNGDYSQKKGDDYPARIYITFDYDKKNLNLTDRIKHSFIKTFTSYQIPLRALNYIWANKAQQGTIAPNAYTNWVYMIAVKSGNSEAETWFIETRNIYEDYLKAFNEAPPNINGVAIMTDTDDTKESTAAYYGDIIFKKNR